MAVPRSVYGSGPLCPLAGFGVSDSWCSRRVREGRVWLQQSKTLPLSRVKEGFGAGFLRSDVKGLSERVTPASAVPTLPPQRRGPPLSFGGSPDRDLSGAGAPGLETPPRQSIDRAGEVGPPLLGGRARALEDRDPLPRRKPGETGKSNPLAGGEGIAGVFYRRDSRGALVRETGRGRELHRQRRGESRPSTGEVE